jgi:Domain of unknown function (DUF6883)
MKLPPDTEIARIKVTQYLLKLREEDDKSKFLAQAGYSVAHTEQLLQDLYGLLTADAELVQKTEYGDKYQICGKLTGQMASRCVLSASG